VQVDQRIDLQEVANTICRVATELGVDAIVVGSHVRGAWDGCSLVRSASMLCAMHRARYSWSASEAPTTNTSSARYTYRSALA
jgi:hypothetical protein